MRVISLAIVVLTGALTAPGSAFGQSAASPPAAAEGAPPTEPPPAAEDPAPAPAPPSAPAPPPAPAPPSAPLPALSPGISRDSAPPAPKRGPYKQVLGPYQRSPPKSDEEQDDERPEYALAEPYGLRTHDGFYARLAGGIGAMSDAIDGAGSALAQNSVSGATDFSGTASGLAFATEAAIGFTPVASLVIGAGIYTVTAPGPESDESGVAGAYEFALTQLELFALFADYYIDARSGLHFQAGAGLCAMIMGQGTPRGEGPSAHAHTAVGPGLMAGGGYEWWIADQWGVGLLGRAIYGLSSGSDPRGVSWEHGTLGWSLLVSATYH